jgi:anti-anti-sigma factor
MEETIEGPRTRLAIRGDFDMQATFTVEPALESALARLALRELVVDLSELEFIDSTGIGVLLRIENEARQRDVTLSIVPPPPEVHRVFEMSGVAEALPFSG